MKREDRWARISISRELVDEIREFMERRGEKKSIAGFLTEAARFYMAYSDPEMMEDIKRRLDEVLRRKEKIKEIIDSCMEEHRAKLHRLLTAAQEGYYLLGFAENDDEDLRCFCEAISYGEIYRLGG